MPSTFTTGAPSTNGQTAPRTSTARGLAHCLLDRAAELAGFLDGADLPPELELDVSASIAAAEGLLARAVTAIEAGAPTQ
jgi:hypothetical protein